MGQQISAPDGKKSFALALHFTHQTHYMGMETCTVADVIDFAVGNAKTKGTELKKLIIEEKDK